MNGFVAIVLSALLPQDAKPAAAGDDLTLYVAVDGDDHWSGLAKASDGKGSGPLRSPQSALRRLREMRTHDPQLRERTTYVRLLAGTYFLDAPLEIGPEDSGSDDHRTFIVGTRAADGAGPDGPVPHPTTVLSGGRRITGWKKTKRLDVDLWVADVPPIDGKPWTFHELFVAGPDGGAGRRATRARHPDKGYLAITGTTDADAAKPWTEGVTRLRISPAELAKMGSGGTAELVLMSRWVESHCRIDSIDVGGGTVTLRDKTVFKPDPGDLFYVESLPSLNAPGEWWLDEKAQQLFYVPRPGEEPATTEIVAPRLTSLVQITGRDDPAQRVEHLGLSAIRFECAEWWFPAADAEAARASGSAQAAISVPAAIAAMNTHDVGFAQCEVVNCGTYGIAFGRGCRANFIVGSWLHELGGGGVKIGETVVPATPDAETAANLVRGCTIQDAGRIFHSAVGVWIGQSPDNRVQENSISDLYYTGISIGWTWGYGAAHAGGNLVEGNAVHHVGVRSDGDGPILSDMGGIYTLGTQEGTVIRRNFFHDVAAVRYGGWGIYFDEGSTHLEATQNVVLRTTHGGFHQHYGKENHVHHNLFAFGRDAQIQRTRPEEHTSFTFDHNVVAWKGGELLAGDLKDGHFDFHENVYEVADAASAKFAATPFADWQKAGRDAKSVVVPLDLKDLTAADRKGAETWSAPRESPIWTMIAPPLDWRGLLLIRDAK